MNLQKLEKKVLSVYGKAFQLTAQNRDCRIRNNKMYKSYYNKRHETFCGDISYELMHLLKRLDIYTKMVEGKYIGSGQQYSEDYNQENEDGIFVSEECIEHTWLMMADGTIIDGSFGQFKPRRSVKEHKDRLVIIPPTDERHKWYTDFSDDDGF